VKNGDNWLVWQRGTETWPAGDVAGADTAGVVLVPGEWVAPAPGALALPQPTASTARHAAADAAVKRKDFMVCLRRARDCGCAAANILNLRQQEQAGQSLWSFPIGPFDPHQIAPPGFPGTDPRITPPLRRHICVVIAPVPPSQSGARAGQHMTAGRELMLVRCPQRGLLHDHAMCAWC
jgi:hypothetical protein